MLERTTSPARSTSRYAHGLALLLLVSCQRPTGPSPVEVKPAEASASAPAATAAQDQHGDWAKSAEAPASDPAADAAQDQDGENRAVAAGSELIGRAAPTFTLQTIDGAQIDLAAHLGKKPIYLKFWATWCVPCRAQMPGFAQIHTRLSDRLEVIAVNTGFGDDEAAVRAYREELGLRMPIVIDDGRLAAAFNLRVTPQHVVIGRDGRIAHIGHLADGRLDAALQAVLAEQAKAVATSTPGQPAVALAPGDVVPDLALTTTGGAAVSLRGAGKPSALMFFAPWCESYLAESRPATAAACRRVREAVEPLAAKADVRWLGVSGNLWASDKDLADYITSTGTKIPLALDASGEVLRAFGVRDIPAVAVLDAEGRLVRLLGPDDTDIVGALASARVATP